MTNKTIVGTNKRMRFRRAAIGVSAVLCGFGLSAADWKDPVSGDWTTAANWVGEVLPSSTALTYITNKTGTASYTITVDSPTTQQTKGLTLMGKTTTGNDASVTYRAILDVKSALSLSGSLSVSDGGRVTLPENGSISIASGSASIGALGQMTVSGGSLTTENAFTGLSVGSTAWREPPKLTISSGTVELKSTASSLSNSSLLWLQNYGKLVMTGGKMTLSAPANNQNAFSSSGYADTANFSLSNDAEFKVTRGMVQFGLGNVDISGNAKLTCSGGRTFWISPYYSDNNKKINVALSGNSQVSATGFDYCEVGKNDARTTGTTVNLTVTGGKHTFGAVSTFGGGSGTYTANLTGGSVTYEGYGLWLGSMPLTLNNVAADRHLKNTAKMTVSNGAILHVKGEQSQYASARKHLWGLVVGQGLCGNRSDYMFRGRLEIGPGGVVTNGTAGAELAEPLFVGAGYATGVVCQTGGTYYGAGAENSFTWDSGAMVLGLCGGYGAYELSGGTATFNTPAWIGGCDLKGKCQRTMESASLPTGSAGKSVGLLKISGGKMMISRHVYVGYDGKGTIDLSGDGQLKIGGNLVLSNSVAQAATLKFTLTDAAKPFLDCGNSLVISDGARLVVDASGCHEAGVRHQLFKSQYAVPKFAASQVELIDDGNGRLRFDETGIWYRRSRGLIISIR